MERPRLRKGDLICGEFEVLALAGVGATSYVYRCTRRGQGEKNFAVKVLHSDLVARPDSRERFLREARFVSSMSHDNIVSAHETINLPGMVAYVMDHVQGPTLRQWFREQAPLTDEDLFSVFFDVLSALDYAHQKGLIHRDLKPGNILMDLRGARPVARLIDFGVARFADAPPDPEDFESIRGTAGYISPDEIRSPYEVCAASDLYSLGVIMYEMACGQRPFTGRPTGEILKAHLDEAPVSPLIHNALLHPALEGIIMRLLSKRPQDRFASVQSLRLALMAALDLSSELEAIPSMVPEVIEFDENLETRVYSRGANFTQAQWVAFAQTIMTALLWVLMNPGTTGRPDDPHYASRSHVDLPGMM